MNEDTRRLLYRYARAIQEVYPGDWHDSDDATECEPCLRKAMSVLTVRDEEMERLRAELAEVKAERDTNFSLVGKLSTSGFECATRLELMTQMRDEEKARADERNVRASELFAVVIQHSQLIREAEAERDALKAAIERVRSMCENRGASAPEWLAEQGEWSRGELGADEILAVLEGGAE